MIEVNLYEFGVIIVGAVVVVIIDTGMGIKWESYPWWKRVIHTAVYVAWGAIFVKLF